MTGVNSSMTCEMVFDVKKSNGKNASWDVISDTERANETKVPADLELSSSPCQAFVLFFSF